MAESDAKLTDRWIKGMVYHHAGKILPYIKQPFLYLFIQVLGFLGYF